MRLQDLKNQLEGLQLHDNYLSDCKLDTSDARTGKLVAIVRQKQHGAIQKVSRYMSYNELAAYMSGYAMCLAVHTIQKGTTG